MDAQTHTQAEPLVEHEPARSLISLSGAVVNLTTEVLRLAALRQDVDELKADVMRLKTDICAATIKSAATGRSS